MILVFFFQLLASTVFNKVNCEPWFCGVEVALVASTVVRETVVAITSGSRTSERGPVQEIWP